MAAKVPLKSVQASYSERAAEALPLVIDGQDTGRLGWSVFPRTGERHSLFVQTASPVQAQSFDLTLCFLSGLAKRYFGNFTLSYTTDPVPSLSGVWHEFVPERFSATGTTLELNEEGHLVAGNVDSMICDAIFHVHVPAPREAVTGFRVDVFPFERPDAPGLRVAWGEYRDFCLTEFRIEAVQNATTNIALGCPVKSSHPLWAGMSANVLTDGLPGSFNHPADPGLGSAFYFEIDLGSIRQIDHIALRGRADGYAADRMSRVNVRVYGASPETGAKPEWEALDRADGTHPLPGAVDVLRARDGKGSCKGRYIRLSSDSPVSYSPQLAEVEVYPELAVQALSIKADGHAVSMKSGLRVPPGTAVLTMKLKVRGNNLPERTPIRWRFRGWNDEWQETDEGAVEVTYPPPGNYEFEAQVRHTDREWNAGMLTVPVTVLAHFWQMPQFYWSVAASMLLAGLGTMRGIARRREARRMAALVYQSALSEERSRIARDMHDEVGARLSQLALMQDLMIRQHAMPLEVERNLRELAVNTRQTVDALDQVVWAVNPLHDTLAGVAAYLSHTACSYLMPLNIACRLDLPFAWPSVEVRAQVRHHLILAFREALQNIAKHAGADAVTFSMRYEGTQLHLCLIDNGRGFPEDPGGIGKDGLANMRARLGAIGGLCTMRNHPEGGAEVEMWAPLVSSQSFNHVHSHRHH